MAAGAAWFVVISTGGAALAQVGNSSDSAATRPARTYEGWSGADTAAPGWSVHGGITAALYGDIRDTGWRVRTAGSFGQYRYKRTYWDANAYKVVDIAFSAERRSVDALFGYQLAWGPATIKVFGGMTQEQKLDAARGTSPIALDDENGFQGERIGLKFALETWTRLADWGFVQADLAWSQPTDSYSGRLRMGYRINQSWSAGPELAAFGNLIPDEGRLGAFARFEWERGEVSVSAGTTHNSVGSEEAYATVSALLRF